VVQVENQDTVWCAQHAEPVSGGHFKVASLARRYFMPCRLEQFFREGSELVGSSVDSSNELFDLASIFPEDKSYFTYPGSLVRFWATDAPACLNNREQFLK
jgi:hypothetical protein